MELGKSECIPFKFSRTSKNTYSIIIIIIYSPNRIVEYCIPEICTAELGMAALAFLHTVELLHRHEGTWIAHSVFQYSDFQTNFQKGTTMYASWGLSIHSKRLTGK